MTARTRGGSQVNTPRKFSNKIVWVLSIFLLIAGFIVISRVLLLGSYPDFTNYYYGTIAFLHGQNPYLGMAKVFAPFAYPPFLFIILSPLTVLPFIIAGKVWATLSILFFLASLYVLITVCDGHKPDHMTVIAIAILVATFFPAKFALGMGQINMLILLGVASFFYLEKKKLDFAAGIVLAVAMSVKLFPILFIPWLILRRRWQILGGCITGLMVCYGVLEILGYGRLIGYYYVHVFPAVASGWKSDYYNQSLSGFLAREVTNDAVRRLAEIAAGFGIVIATFISIVSSKDRKRFILEGSLVLVANVLINAFSWQHHFVWIIPALIAVWFAVREFHVSWLLRTILFVGYVLVASNIRNPDAVPVLLRSHVFYGALLLWGGLLWIIMRRYHR